MEATRRGNENREAPPPQGPGTDREPEAQARLRELARVHADFVWRSLRRMGVPERHTDDATQEVFMITARRLESIEVGKERAFLFAVAANVAAHARRTVARSREVSDDSGVLAAADSAPDAEARLARSEKRRVLDRVLDGMPDELRTVFVLFEMEELTMAAIASMLDVPSGTVASRLRRAREAFQTSAKRERAIEQNSARDGRLEKTP